MAKEIMLRANAIFFSVMLAATALSCHEPIANTSGPPPGSGSGERDLRESLPVNSMGNYNASKKGARSDKKPGPGSRADRSVRSDSVFMKNLTERLVQEGKSISDIMDESDPVERRVLKEYGAVFLSSELPPERVLFTDEASVSGFQERAGYENADLDGFTVELQPVAMRALLAARAEAAESGLKITPRDGEEAGRRNYRKTLDLWNDRFYRACDHWVRKGRLTEARVSSLKALPIKEQIKEVLELEKEGIFFNTFFNNSILYSVAAPGTSQHLSMLAFDANEYGNERVRAIMAAHGWFRTVKNDAPHFTYLGVKEGELTGLGLKKVKTQNGGFWVPDM